MRVATFLNRKLHPDHLTNFSTFFSRIVFLYFLYNGFKVTFRFVDLNLHDCVTYFGLFLCQMPVTNCLCGDTNLCMGSWTCSVMRCESGVKNWTWDRWWWSIEFLRLRIRCWVKCWSGWYRSGFRPYLGPHLVLFNGLAGRGDPNICK